MVHLRLNESESNPNPHVNFITALCVGHSEDKEAARQLLRALAAQVRPIMKSHGFVVNSLEEYEHNSVFAGRNWNHGETVELVLRRPDGSFFPAYWLISVFCHELAHIKHMNHGSDFQALWRRLRADVRSLQDKGYYGDGYWSAGQRLVDSARVAGDGIDPGDLPEFMCGGAQTRARPTSIRRFRGAASGLASRKRRRKAGTRVSTSAFAGQGSKLSENSADGTGIGFRKQARSKRAREERALAVEKRVNALQGTPMASSPKEESGDDSQGEVEIVETDAQRRQTLLNSSERDGDLARLDNANTWKEFQREFDFRDDSSSSDATGCDLPVPSGSTFIAGQSAEESKGKMSAPPQASYKKLVQSQTQSRKKNDIADSDDELTVVSESQWNPRRKTPSNSLPQWECLVCTLFNQPAHLACSACGTTRGESNWKGS